MESIFELQNELFQKKTRGRQDEIQIGFGLHDKNGDYSVWVGVAMQSVIEHTSAQICFHILHDDTLNTQNRDKLIKVAMQNGKRIQFHLFNNSFGEKVKEKMGRYTIGMMFRVVLPELLPGVEKIIYLDADILVNRDIKELWDIDMQDYCLAAVPDYPTVNGRGKPYPVAQKVVLNSRYFNAGVLFMNLDRIRAHGNMSRNVIEYLEDNPGAYLPDQDALNVVYGDDTLLLEESWNTFTSSLRYIPNKPLENRIYHFAATKLMLYSMPEIDRAYYETICRTPWGFEENRKWLHKSLARTDERLRLLEGVITLVSTYDKKKIFYGKETNAMKNLYNMLTIHECDYRILGEILEEDNVILPCRPFADLAKE